MKNTRGWITGLIGGALLVPGFAAYAAFTDLDNSFGSNGLVTVLDPETNPQTESADISDVSEGPDGSLYIQVGEDEVSHLSSTGVLDTSFGKNGYLVLNGVTGVYSLNALTVDVAEQLIYVAAVNINTQAISILAFDFSGMPVKSFGTSGVQTITSLVFSAAPSGLELLNNGDLLMVGNDSSSKIFFAVELSSSGAPEQNFGKSGVATVAIPQASDQADFGTGKGAVDSSGRVYLTGEDDTGSGSSNALIVRFTATGSPDTSFGNQGVLSQSLTTTTAYFSSFNLISVQADGTLSALGSYATSTQELVDGNYTLVLDTFSASGQLLSSQSSAFNAPFGITNTLQQADGKFVLVGHSETDTTAPAPNVARLLGLTSASGGTSTGGSTTGGTTATGGSTTGASSSGSGSGSFSPLILTIGLAAILRRRGKSRQPT